MILTVVVFRWLGTAKSPNFVDVLFFEGAVLIVAGGLCDFGRSITFSHIRALIKSNASAPPPIKRTRLAGILLIAGLLLCAHAVLWIYF